MDETTYPPLSASERWGRHYIWCEVCQIDEREPEKDRLCAIGSELRAASIEAWRTSEPRGDNSSSRKKMDVDSRGSGPIQGAA